MGKREFVSAGWCCFRRREATSRGWAGALAGLLLAGLVGGLLARPRGNGATAAVPAGGGTSSDQVASVPHREPGDALPGPGQAVGGENAVAQLQAEGRYTSLMEALSAARYGVLPLPAEEGYLAPNPANGFRAQFTAAGVEVSPGRAAAVPWQRLALRLQSLGVGETLLPVPPATPMAANPRPDCNRVEYRRETVTEWYENRPLGLEQGFTLTARPAGGRPADPLTLVLAVDSDLSPVPVVGLAGESTAISFVGTAGERGVGYKDLQAWDATGRTLPARMAVQGQDIALVIDDSQASYPVTIDPLLYTETVIVPDGIAEGNADDQLGSSVSLSGDTVVIGAPFDDTPAGRDAGSAYVFMRSGTTWTQQAHLTAGDGGAEDSFGGSVSASGDTVVVGARYHDTAAGGNAGSAYVFVRSGMAWTQQAVLMVGDGSSAGQFGASVAASGETVVVGAPAADTGAGAAYVFLRSGTTWAQQARMTAADGGSGDGLGSSVSLSGDTAVVGAYFDDTPAGADAGSAYVFARSGTTWTQQARFVAADGKSNDRFGSSVSVSGDTAVVGAPSADSAAGVYTGAAYVMVRSGVAWTQQAKLAASDGASGDGFGHSVSVSGDTALVGADYADTAAGADAGAAYVLVRSGTTWTEQSKLGAAGGATNDLFGFSVSVSDGTAVVGVPGSHAEAGDFAGAASVFVRSGVTWSQQQQLFLAGAGAAPQDRFGYAVSVSGDTAVVGVPNDSVAAAAYAGSAYVFVHNGALWSQQALLTPSEAQGGDGIGSSVGVSGDTVVLGAPGTDTPSGDGAGAAYVFVRSGTVWTEQARITVDDGVAVDPYGFLFGHSVSVSGDTVVVGVPRDDAPARQDIGSAYVFVRSGTTWTQQAKLATADAAAFDHFGTSVSVSGDSIAVGAPDDNTMAGDDAGSLSVFVRSGTTWTHQAKLTAADAAAADRLGSSVMLSGDVVLAGAPDDDTVAGTDAGSAYVFGRSGTLWTQQAQLTASAAAALDCFGSSVALSGVTALVGAPLDDTPAGADAGSAYAFVANGTNWTQQAHLTASNGAAGDTFGSAVALSGNLALAGAPLHATLAGPNAGSAYAYQFLAGLDHFLVEAAGGGDIGTQTAGTPFSIAVTAKDSAERTVETFTGTVDITSTGSLAAGGGTTASFLNGVLAAHSLTFASGALNRTLTATRTGGTETGTSNPFNVRNAYVAPPTNPGATDIGTTSITWTWDDQSTDETGFKVYAGAGGAPGTVTHTTAANVESWQQTGLTPSTEYAMQVAATNAYADSSKTSTSWCFTLPATPVAPVVSNPTATTLDVAIGSGDGNSADAGYAIQFSPAVGGNSWVKTDGSLGTIADWRTASAWGTMTVTGLQSGQTYTIGATARNGDGVESDPGPGATGTPAAQISATPGTPDLLAASDTGASASDDLTTRNNSTGGSALQFAVSGTVVGATVKVYTGGVEIGVATATGATTTVTTSGTQTLADGTPLITARQTEPLKLESAASGALAVTVDTRPPELAARAEPDTTFGAGGAALADGSAAGLDDGARDLAVLADGRLLTAGYAEGGGGRAFCVSRFLSGGALDITFGGNGAVLTPVGPTDAEAFALAVQSDGNVLAVGRARNAAGNDEWALVRYTPEGDLDGGFGTGGIVTTDLSSSTDVAYGLVLQWWDQRPVVVGVRHNGSDYDMAVTRYNPDGSVDPTYGTAGTTVVALNASADDVALGAAIQPDGKVVLAGRTAVGGRQVLAAVRLTALGALDPTFGAGGAVTLAAGTGDAGATAVAVQPDGRVVLVGTAVNGAAGLDLAAARWSASGTPDASFGTGGLALLDVAGADDRASDLAVQADGRLLLAGSTVSAGRRIMLLSGLTAGGGLDPGFGHVPLAVGDAGGDAEAYGVALAPGGKIVAAGKAYNGSDDDTALVQLQGVAWEVRCTHDAGVGEVWTAVTDGYLESRAGGLACVAVRLDEAVAPATVTTSSLTITDDLASTHAVGGATVAADGRALVFTFAPLPDGRRYTFDLAATVTDWAGCPLAGVQTLHLGALAGDVDGDGDVDLDDLTADRTWSTVLIVPAAARYDVTADGRINVGDLLAIRARMGGSLP